jgi:hypothetical protein
MGAKLNDTFESGMTELDGVPIPYAGWIEQMKDCSPTVAQALLPYPQYCGTTQGLNEQAGSSSYHSFQAKLEKRFSAGLYILGSYTMSKLLSSGSAETQRTATTWNGSEGNIYSPYERWRNKSLAPDDVPQVFSLALVYDMPFGKGKRWLNQGGAINHILGNWQVSTVFRKSSGVPYFFRSGHCNIPGEFAMSCVPGILGNPFLQDVGNWDVNKPLFDKNAFQPTSYFDYYGGSGPRISNFRGQSYEDQDFALIKQIRVGEHFRWEIRAEFFNMWNWHIFNSGSAERGSNSVNNDINSADFGMWNGAVTDPRNIQLGTRLSW